MADQTADLQLQRVCFQTLFIFILLLILSIMYNNVALTSEQTAELKASVSRILEDNMVTYASKAAVDSTLQTKHDLDSLFEFSQTVYDELQKTLQNLAQFTFTVLSNFELVWEEVHHRQARILDLRNSLSTATSYAEEVKEENDLLRQNLTEAETYIEWMEEQKEYLDAIYYERSNNSSLAATHSDKNFNRCVSERSLHNSRNGRKNCNYDKLREYVDALKEERNDLQKELLNLTKKYEIKQQDCKKANVLIQFMVEQLNRKDISAQSDVEKEQRNYPFNSARQSRQMFRNQLTSDDILRMLQKTENISSSSLKNNLNLLDQDEQRMQYPSFDSFTKLNQSPCKEEQSDNVSFFMGRQRQTKDMGVGTSQFHWGKKAAACQTHCSDSSTASEQEKVDYKISIQIVGSGADRHDKITKIIQDLDLEQEISMKLKQKQIKKKEQGRTKQEEKGSDLNKTLLSAYEYYRNRVVASRIKKYRFSGPDSKKQNAKVK